MANAELNIQLSPELLLQQSQEMLSLKSEYEALFQNTLADLQGVNSSWSEFLSNNFSAKIQSAQKSFSGVETMLQNGAYAASLAANGLSSVDSTLSKFIASAQLGLASGDNVTNPVPERGKKEAKVALKATGDLIGDIIGIPYSVAKFGTSLLKGNYFGAISSLKGMVDSTVNTAQDAVSLALLGIGKATSLFTDDDKYQQLFYEEAEKYQKSDGLTGAMESADMPDWAINISKTFDIVGDTSGVIGKGVGFVGDVSKAEQLFSDPSTPSSDKVDYAKEFIFKQFGFSDVNRAEDTSLGGLKSDAGFLGNIKSVYDWTNGVIERKPLEVLVDKGSISGLMSDWDENVQNICESITGDPTIATDGLDSTTSKIADSLLGVREAVAPWTV